MLAFLHIIGGLALLVFGGDTLVKGAVGIAKKLGISAAVIGLTVVAFGTSLPEMIVSIKAAYTNHGDIAVGNVIGSNITNILLVIGATSLIYPVATQKQMARRDGTIMLLISLLAYGLARDGMFGPVEGMILFTALILYTVHAIYDARKQNFDPQWIEEVEEETEAITLSLPRSALFCLIGLALLMLGSDILIDGAVAVAKLLGLSEAVIGVTVVAIGTSAPELFASAMAAFRRHADIALGNIVGSNIFNLSSVIGAAAIVAPLPVAAQFLRVDFPVMLGVTILFFVAMLARKRISRIEGAVMLAGFAAYIGWQYNLVSII